jgi:hypothetical protein
MRTDLELLCCPGRGKFTRNTDCRVVACFEEAAFNADEMQAAHIVLSPSGLIGEAGQVRLKLDDVEGFWAAVVGMDVVVKRMAA